MKASKINNKVSRASRKRKFKAMADKARELGFNSLIEAENAGCSNELKKAYTDEK